MLKKVAEGEVVARPVALLSTIGDASLWLKKHVEGFATFEDKPSIETDWSSMNTARPVARVSLDSKRLGVRRIGTFWLMELP